MGQMVLLIDERMEDKESRLGVGEASALLSRSRELLRADASGDAFQRLYYQALQLSPELAVLHGQVSTAHRATPDGPSSKLTFPFGARPLSGSAPNRDDTGWRTGSFSPRPPNAPSPLAVRYASRTDDAVVVDRTQTS